MGWFVKPAAAGMSSRGQRRTAFTGEGQAEARRGEGPGDVLSGAVAEANGGLPQVSRGFGQGSQPGAW